MFLFGKHLAVEMELGSPTWIKKESTKYPGKCYYFNTKSGESSWTPPAEHSTSAVISKKKPNNSCTEKLIKARATSGICKSSKTPAQDRLNKLQAKLAIEQFKKEKCKVGSSDTKFKLNKNVETTQNICQKTDVGSREDGRNAKASTSQGKSEPHKKLRESNKEVPNYKQKAVKRSSTTAEPSALSKFPRLAVKALAKIPKLISDKLTRSTKEKDTFNLAQSTKSQESQEVIVAETKSISVTNESKLAADDLQINNSQRDFQINLDKRRENMKSTVLAGVPHSSSNKPFLIVRKLESANDRLRNLRKALDEQRKLSEQSNCPSHAANISSSSITEPNREYSPMEWEEIQEQINEKIIEIRQDNDKEDEGVLGDFYNIVNQNLLKLCAEQSNDNFVKGNCFYFIVDTNVFLQNLSFVDDLRKLKFCSTEGSVIVVPYSVLQELDRIKQRSNTAVCTLAVRAIKYLNKRFEAKDERVKGQNAIEANRHLISIENADDNILNCCLQVKTKTDKILLLTNDVNLRNKALCNGIPVSTKGDLNSTESLNTT